MLNLHVYSDFEYVRASGVFVLLYLYCNTRYFLWLRYIDLETKICLLLMKFIFISISFNVNYLPSFFQLKIITRIVWRYYTLNNFEFNLPKGSLIFIPASSNENGFDETNVRQQDDSNTWQNPILRKGKAKTQFFLVSSLNFF